MEQVESDADTVFLLEQRSNDVSFNILDTAVGVDVDTFRVEEGQEVDTTSTRVSSRAITGL